MGNLSVGARSDEISTYTRGSDSGERCTTIPPESLILSRWTKRRVKEREEGGEGASISSALDVPLKIKEKAIARPPTYTAVSADERDGRVSGLWTLS